MDLKAFFNQRDKYGAKEDEVQKNISVFTIDGNVFSGYGLYTFVRVVEYVTEPTRSQNGQIANLDSYTTFITPKLRIKFNAMSIDTYRKLMSLMLSKREFDVGCWDFVADRWVHQNMYFYPNDYPEIFQYDLEVLAVMNYEIELIGTNTHNQNITITLNSHYPTSRGSSGDSRVDVDGIAVTGDVNYTLADVFESEPTHISYPSTFVKGKKIIVDTVEFNFSHWSTKPYTIDHTGKMLPVHDDYLDDADVTLFGDTTLYAIWDSGITPFNFVYEMDGAEQTDKRFIAKGRVFSSDTYAPSWIREESGKKYKYTISSWYKTSELDEADNNSVMGLYPHEVPNSIVYGKVSKNLYTEG